MVTIYNAMAVAETAGDLISGPLVAGMFSTGQRLGGEWLGLFFMAMALFYLMATAAIWAIRYREPLRMVWLIVAIRRAKVTNIYYIV
jgi:hypothetical protein